MSKSRKRAEAEVRSELAASLGSTLVEVRRHIREYPLKQTDLMASYWDIEKSIIKMSADEQSLTRQLEEM